MLCVKLAALLACAIPVSAFAGDEPPASTAVRGRVVTAAGGGVPDAHVFLLPPRPSDGVQATSTAADPDGRFVLRAPTDRTHVCAVVVVPHVETMMLPFRVGSGETEVRIEPIGGTLTLRYVEPEDGRVPVLLHADCYASLPDLRARTRKDGEMQEATLTSMEPGAYSFCLVTPDALDGYRGGAPRVPGCVSGDLPQNGTLDLTP